MLEDNIKLREKSEARFQAFFDKELNRLKNDFRNEAEVGGEEMMGVFVFCSVVGVLLVCMFWSTDQKLQCRVHSTTV